MTPLHFAAWAGRRETAELLVRHGAPLDARDGLNQDTPLGWATHNGQRDPRLLELLGAGGDPAG